MCTWELVCFWGTLSLCPCLCIQDEDRVYSSWIYFLFGLHLMLFKMISKNIVGYQLEVDEDSLWAGFNCHDLIVNSCFQLLHILSWCSYENFILGQDNNFYQIEYLSILITCLLNNVCRGVTGRSYMLITSGSQRFKGFAWSLWHVHAAGLIGTL